MCGGRPAGGRQRRGLVASRERRPPGIPGRELAAAFRVVPARSRHGAGRAAGADAQLSGAPAGRRARGPAQLQTAGQCRERRAGASAGPGGVRASGLVGRFDRIAARPCASTARCADSHRRDQAPRAFTLGARAHGPTHARCGRELKIHRRSVQRLAVGTRSRGLAGRIGQERGQQLAHGRLELFARAAIARQVSEQRLLEQTIQ